MKEGEWFSPYTRHVMGVGVRIRKVNMEMLPVPDGIYNDTHIFNINIL